jgi:hypothetical protein
MHNALHFHLNRAHLNDLQREAEKRHKARRFKRERKNTG